jgi:RNA polymerase sigma-70 factor, ECF subfamily
MLMPRLVAGEEQALGELYDRHNRLLFGVIFRILGQRDEAEDVLQEVFLTAWTKAAIYDPALGSPAGWLIGIARHRALDRLRAAAVRSRTVDAAAADVAPAPTPEHQAAASEQHRTVGNALDELPAEQRRLIEDAYFLGLTHSELADRHGLPLGTVKTRIRAGMLALRQHLSPTYAEQ